MDYVSSAQAGSMTSKKRALDNQSPHTSRSKSDSTLTRREALRWAVSAAAVGALGPTLLEACATNSSASPGNEVDVAIIGGGPSALYAAYRLLTGTPRSGSPVAKGSGKNGRPTVAIYEATDRLCGRIWSVVPPGAPHLIAEFGGMRFLDTQEIVPRLIKALSLPTVPFTVGNGQNLNYLRGVRFTMAQYSDPSVVPYMLPPSEQGMTPGQLTLQGIQTYVPNAPNLTGAQWESVKMTATYQGKLLADQGFWNLMEQALSAEGYSLMSDGIDYPSFFVENWNAVEQMQELAADFAPGASYFTIPGGYMRLPLTLAAMAQHAGASVHLKNRLTSLSPASGGGVNLTMSVPGGTSKVTAQHVIMALPKDPMDAVVQRSPFLQDSTFSAALDTVGTAPAAKLFFTFSNPWWTSVGITGGYSITDLPIKRCWYFGSEGSQPGANPANTTSLLMCYNDFTPAGYWAAYGSSEVFNGPPEPRVDPSEMVASAIQQLSELHGVAVSQPLWSAYINWENLPYGNGFHFWNVNAHSWEVIPYLRQPFDGVNLSICGDCWSPAQKWIESGLTTTEGLLQSKFRYQPPPWLPEGLGIST
jgi:lysine 2-monooxygenase